MVRGVAVEPLFVVLALCWLTSNSGQARARIAQRYAFLFRVEDNAAVWVSYAAALLRNGHIPQNGLRVRVFRVLPGFLH